MTTPAMPWLIGPAHVRPAPITRKNNAIPAKGYPIGQSGAGTGSQKPAAMNRPGQRRVGEPAFKAAPVPAIVPNGTSLSGGGMVQSGAGTGMGMPGDGGFGHNRPPDDMKLPPPTRERHALRGPEEYPMDRASHDAFYIERPDPKRGIVGDWPEGRALQWIGITVWGQPQPSIEATYAQGGWEPVHTEDFHERYAGRFVPRSQPGPIVKDGQLLAARPMSWQVLAREREHREAMAPLQIKVRQITQGESDKITMGAQHKTALSFNHVNMSVEGVNLPAPPEG